MTEPQPHLNGRRLPWPRGRVLGGSSSLNAMVYVRGHAKDYDRCEASVRAAPPQRPCPCSCCDPHFSNSWEAKGAKGWSYADCLPYFKRAQTHEKGEDVYRGGDGPLHVSRGKQICPLFQAFELAGVQAG